MRIYLILTALMLLLTHISKAQRFSIEAVNSYTIITSPSEYVYFRSYSEGLKTILPSYGLELSYRNNTNSLVSYSFGTSFGSKNLISVPFYINYNWNHPIISSVGLGLNYFHRDDNNMRQVPQVINDIQICGRLKKDFTLTPKFQAGVSANLAYGIVEHSFIVFYPDITYKINFHYLLFATNFSLKYNF